MWARKWGANPGTPITATEPNAPVHMDAKAEPACGDQGGSRREAVTRVPLGRGLLGTAQLRPVMAMRVGEYLAPAISPAGMNFPEL